jgi:hypothetical protein
MLGLGVRKLDPGCVQRAACRTAPSIAIITGNFCTSITILRRRSALSIRMNAPISLKPSELATKSVGDAERIGQLRLAHCQHLAAHAHPAADVPVGGV